MRPLRKALGQFGEGLVVAEQAIHLAGAGERRQPVRLGDRRAGAVGDGAHGLNGSWIQTMQHRFPHILGHHGLGLAGIDHDATARLLLGDIEKGPADPLMQHELLPLEAVELGPLGALLRPRQSVLGRNIENEGDVRRQGAHGQPFERADKRRAARPPSRPDRRAWNR